MKAILPKKYDMKGSCILLVFLLFATVVIGQINFENSVLLDADQWDVSLTTGDMNNDGLNDLVSIGCPGPGINYLEVRINYQNDLNEMENPPVVINVQGDAGHKGIEVEDMDQNGWLDIVYVSGYSISILYQTSPGNFTSDNWSNMNAAIKGFGVGDLNNDGLPDVVYNNNLTGNFSIAFQQPDNTFIHEVQVDLYEIDLYWDFHIEDVNNDGLNDLVIGGKTNTLDEHDIVLFLQTAAGFWITANAVINAFGRSIELGDLNNDGILDVITTEGSWELQPTLNEYVQTATFLTGGKNTGVDVADINCDGYLDVVLSHSAFSFVSVYLGSASGFQPQYEIDLPYYYTNRHGLVIADLNDDNRLDIALGRYLSNSGNLVMYNGSTPLPSTYQVTDTLYYTAQSITQVNASSVNFVEITIDSTEECWTTYIDSYLVNTTAFNIVDTLYTKLIKESEFCGTTLIDSTITFTLDILLDVIRDTFYLGQTVIEQTPCIPTITPHDAIVHLYPNPTSGLVNVTLPETFEGETLLIKIFDPIGKEVSRFVPTNILPDNLIELDFSSRSSGLYLIAISGRETCYGKLVIARP